MKYHFITPVWGASYVETFLNVALENLLTPGNLLAFAGDSDSLYQIYTAPDDVETISSHPNFVELQKILPTDIRVMEDLYHSSQEQGSGEHGDVISSMNSCHCEAIAAANAVDAAAVFIPPDKVWSEGSFAYMRDVAEAGKRVLAIASFRLNKETFIPDLVKQFRNNKGRIPVPPRDLTALALRHLHPIAKSYIIDSETYLNSSQLFWRVNESGLLARFFHLHLMMVYPKEKSILPTVSFDANFVGEACPDIESYHIVTDSDDLSAFELSPACKLGDLIKTQRFQLYEYVRLVLFHTDEINRYFLSKKIRLHAEDISPEWERVEKESDKLIDQVLDYDSVIRELLPYAVILPVNADAIKSVAIFGSGQGGVISMGLAKKFNWEVRYVVDNDSRKWGETLNGFHIKDPEILRRRDVDMIIVASMTGRGEIFKQLREEGFLYKKDFVYFLDTVRVGDFEMRLKLTPEVVKMEGD